MLLIPSFDLTKKVRFQVIKIFARFCQLFLLTLDWNSAKGLSVTKIVKKDIFEEVCCDLAPKKCFQK